MVYKLDDADKLCGVTYIDWSKKYSPIPKATCETIKPKCSSGGGGSSDDALDLSCEEIKKLIHGEDKPKEDKPNEDTPNEGNKEETPKEDNPQENKPTDGEKPKEEETPRENNTPVENNTPREENPSDNVGGNPNTEEKPTTDEVTPKENEPSPSPRVEDTPRTEETPAEPTPEPPVSDTPTEGNASDNLGDIPTEDNQEVNLLELMPEVKDRLSTIYIQAKISSVINPNNEEKEAFERKIIETLKSKLPEGAVVEAVLGEPYYKVGMEYSEEITNYKLNVRVRLNGKVYEHEYSVPNNIEYIGITDYI